MKSINEFLFSDIFFYIEKIFFLFKTRGLKKIAIANKNFGVNLAGYLAYDTGVSEVARSIARLFKKTNIPFVLNNIGQGLLSARALSNKDINKDNFDTRDEVTALALAYARLGNRKQALAIFKECFRDPKPDTKNSLQNNEDTLIYKVWVYSKCRLTKMAVETAHQLKDSYKYHNFLSMVYADTKDFYKAFIHAQLGSLSDLQMIRILLQYYSNNSFLINKVENFADYTGGLSQYYIQ